MTKDNLNSESGPELQAIICEVADLKRDLAALVRSRKSEFSDDVTSVRKAAGHIGDEALHAYENLADRGERSVKAIGHSIEKNPATSLLVAFAVGFLGSRLLSR